MRVSKFIILVVSIAVLFVLNLLLGTVKIPVGDVLASHRH